MSQIKSVALPKDSNSELQKLLQGWKYNIPINVHFEVTYKCNQSCVHCYEVIQDKVPELETVEIYDILEQLTKARTLFLSLSGGEIFNRSDIFSIMEYAQKLGFAIRLFTNCTLITPEVAKKVRAIYPIEIETSLYGATADTHDAITKIAGSFHKTLTGIRYLKNEGLKVLVKVLLHRENIHQVNDMKLLIKELGVSFLIGATISPKEDGSMSPLAHRVLNHQLDTYCKIHQSDTRKPKEHAFNMPVCATGRSVVAISPNGEIFPCAGFRKSIGNLRENSFQDIWFTKPHSLINELRLLTFKKLPTCSSCKNENFCMLCIGLNDLENKDFMIPSKEACRFARYIKLAYE